MAIKFHKPTSPGRRGMSGFIFEEITTNIPEKSLLAPLKKKGGRNNIGPALYNVLGRNMGALEDYKYSKALIAFGKDWTFQEMNSFLIKPASYIKGTKMAFAGLKKEKDRASVILYMNANADNPLQLP